MNMKKCIIVVVILVFVSAASAGCSASDVQDTNTTVPVTTPVESQESTLTPSETPEPETVSTPTSTPEPEPTEGTTEDTDLRNVRWGMGLAEVIGRENEGTLLSQESDFLAFMNVSVAGYDAMLGYLFNTEDQLYGANYVITEEHTNKTAYISDFEDIKSKLIDKYGQPKEEDVFWYDDLYKDDPSDWGMAIITGDLKYYATWETESTFIILLLEGDNYKVSFKLQYKSMIISNDSGETGSEGL